MICTIWGGGGRVKVVRDRLLSNRVRKHGVSFIWTFSSTFSTYCNGYYLRSAYCFISDVEEREALSYLLLYILTSRFVNHLCYVVLNRSKVARQL